MKIALLVAVLSMTSMACKKEHELTRSTFVPDQEIPDLPAYSEWGYNTFGAFFDRELFVSNDELVPLKVVSTNDTTSLIFRGQKGYSYTDNGPEEMSMTIKMTDFHPERYTDLLDLHQTELDLTQPIYQVIVETIDGTFEAQVLNGRMEFRRAQHLLVDGEPIEAILSGTFDFQALIDGEPVSISNGRFDVGVGQLNFFSF